MTPTPPFDAQHLESIARILADTSEGLTGSQIGKVLQDCRIPDVAPTDTKWRRLYNAFVGFQNERQFGNHVLKFTMAAMNPVRYTAEPHVFALRRDKLNAIFAFSGMELGQDGKFRSVSSSAASLDEALQRAGRLHASLVSRQVHADVLVLCRAELVQNNYFHAVFEAMKSITQKLRLLSGLTSDGAQLVQGCFNQPNSGRPLLGISTLQTDSEKGEQRGFTSLLIGLYGTVRNPLAHNPKMEWPVSEQDALDILTTLSFVHRKLDRAQRMS